MSVDYDVVIVGGGMVGATLACALLPVAEELDLRIAVVEAKALQPASDPAYQPSYDSRTTALALCVRDAYQRMGIWDTLEEHLTAIKRVHVSDRGHFGVTRLEAEREQVPALGYVVENHWLGEVLLHKLEQSGGDRVEFICPATVTAIENRAEGSNVEVQVEGETRTLSTSLVAIADGGRSGLLQELGIACRESSYGQHALVTTVSLDRSHNNIAYERFTDRGPIALLPAEDLDGQSRCGVIWTVPEDRIATLMEMPDAEFMAYLQERFGFRAGQFVRVGRRFNYPLKLVLADEQVRSGLVVLGNAAHYMHPIAGQGYNLAFRGVMALADLIIERRRAGQSLGDLSALSEMEQQRFNDQFRTIQFSDKTLKLFSNNRWPLSSVRGLGLLMLDNIPLAKTLMARAAMGIDVPAAQLR